MKLSDDDKKLLKELCLQNQVSFEKVLKLLETEQAFEFKERRTGVYDALRDVVRSSLPEEVKHEVS